jgi:hypothetical protein
MEKFDEKSIDLKELVKVQARMRGFLDRIRYNKIKNEHKMKKQEYQYNIPRGSLYRGAPPRGPPGMGPPGMGPPGMGPPGMQTFYTEEKNIDDEKKTDDDAEVDENSNKDKNVTKKKSISLNNIISLAKLVQKEVVNEDEFRDIVKRIRKRNEEVEWSLKQELILKAIGEKSCCYFLLHRDISENYRKMYQKSMMWIFTQTMISSVVMFVASGMHNSCEEDALLVIPLVAGTLNLLIAFQQKILEFKQPERFMLEHATSSKSFREIYDDINIQLGLARKERSPMPLYLSNIRDKYGMCKKIAPYVSKSSYNEFENTYLNIDDPTSFNNKNRGNFMNAYQLYREKKYKAYDSNEIITSNKFSSIDNDINSFEILTRKKQNGIPEDILGLTPIDISRRDILLSDVKRGLDNDEELYDYKLRSKHKMHQLKKKYKEDEEEYSSDINFDLNSSNNSSDISDDENDKQPVLLLRGVGSKSKKIGEENV